MAAAYLHQPVDGILARYVMPKALAQQLQGVPNVNVIP